QPIGWRQPMNGPAAATTAMPTQAQGVAREQISVGEGEVSRGDAGDDTSFRDLLSELESGVAADNGSKGDQRAPQAGTGDTRVLTPLQKLIAEVEALASKANADVRQKDTDQKTDAAPATSDAPTLPAALLQLLAVTPVSARTD